MQADPDSLVANRALRYGHPYDNFQRIALIWESITGRKYTRHEVGLMLAGTKIARQVPGYDEDSCDDLGGYGRAIEAVHLRESGADDWAEVVPDDDEPWTVERLTEALATAAFKRRKR